MKKILSILFLYFILAGSGLYAQDVSKSLREAGAAYESGDLEAARFALRQAMNEIDLAIGNEVLLLFPETMGDMSAVKADDEVTSAGMGLAGLFVSRTYRMNDETFVRVQVVGDSPLLAGINTILALPVLGRDANQKRIRVGSYRALLQKNQDETGKVSWDLQVPFGSSLLTMEFNGVPEEALVTEMAHGIPVEQVAKLLQ